MTGLVLPQQLFSYLEVLHSHAPIAVILGLSFVGILEELGGFSFFVKNV